MTRARKLGVAIGIGLALALGSLAAAWLPRLAAWRELDRTYAEEFPEPAALAPSLAGKRVLFHMKTGLAQDDSQICVGFNIILAAIEAGADVTVLFDAGALLDIKGEESKLAATGVPERLRKVIAAQSNLPLADMPEDYGQYLEYLHRRGADVHANTAMLIVTGDASRVHAELPSFPFVQSAPYARVAELVAGADDVIVY